MRNVLVLVASVLLLAACGDDSDSSGGTGPVTPTPVTPTPVTPTPVTPTPVPPAAGAGATPPAASVAGCEVADMTGDTHALALGVLTAATPCGFSSCHQGAGKAGLVLSGATDLATTLVGVASCEAPNLSLVDGAGGDAGLNNSWLWQKMVAPAMPGGELTPDATWGTPGSCGQMGVGSYGTRMPAGGSDAVLDDARLAPVRNWICAGAPGPM